MSSGGAEIAIDHLTEAPPNRLNQYPSLIGGWHDYARKNGYETTRVKQRIWAHEGLVVRANPEMALRDNNRINYVKLHLKTDSPGHHHRDVMQRLIHEMLVEDANEQVSVLNVRKGRLVTSPKALPYHRLSCFLRSCAVRFHRAIGYFCTSRNWH